VSGCVLAPRLTLEDIDRLRTRLPAADARDHRPRAALIETLIA